MLIGVAPYLLTRQLNRICVPVFPRQMQPRGQLALAPLFRPRIRARFFRRRSAAATGAHMMRQRHLSSTLLRGTSLGHAYIDVSD